MKPQQDANWRAVLRAERENSIRSNLLVQNYPGEQTGANRTERHQVVKGEKQNPPSGPPGNNKRPGPSGERNRAGIWADRNATSKASNATAALAAQELPNVRSARERDAAARERLSRDAMFAEAVFGWGGR